MRAPWVGPEAWEQKTVSQGQLCHQPSGGTFASPIQTRRGLGQSPGQWGGSWMSDLTSLEFPKLGRPRSIPLKGLVGE